MNRVNNYLMDTTIANSVLDVIVQGGNAPPNGMIRVIFLKAALTSTLETIWALFRTIILGLLVVFTGLCVNSLQIRTKDSYHQLSTSFSTIFLSVSGIFYPTSAKSHVFGLLLISGPQTVKEALIRAMVRNRRWFSEIDLRVVTTAFQKQSLDENNRTFFYSFFVEYCTRLEEKKTAANRADVDRLTLAIELRNRDNQVWSAEEKVVTLQGELDKSKLDLSNVQTAANERVRDAELRIGLLQIELDESKKQLNDWLATNSANIQEDVAKQIKETEEKVVGLQRELHACREQLKNSARDSTTQIEQIRTRCEVEIRKISSEKAMLSEQMRKLVYQSSNSRIQGIERAWQVYRQMNNFPEWIEQAMLEVTKTPSRAKDIYELYSDTYQQTIENCEQFAREMRGYSTDGTIEGDLAGLKDRAEKTLLKLRLHVQTLAPDADIDWGSSFIKEGKQEGNVFTRDVPGDGNCFFYCFAFLSMIDPARRAKFVELVNTLEETSYRKVVLDYLLGLEGRAIPKETKEVPSNKILLSAAQCLRLIAKNHLNEDITALFEQEQTRCDTMEEYTEKMTNSGQFVEAMGVASLNLAFFGDIAPPTTTIRHNPQDNHYTLRWEKNESGSSS